MLAALAVGLAIGIAIAPWLSAGPWALLGWPLVAALRHRPWLAAVLLGLLAVGPAAWWTECRQPTPGPHDISLAAPRRFIRLTGTIATPPEPRGDAWRAEVDLGPRGRVMAAWPASTRPWVGDRWAWAGRLSRPQGPMNPGGFDYPTYLARRDLYATFRAESGVRLGADPNWRAHAAVDALRMRLLAGLSVGLPPDQAALFGSLVLGGGAAPVPEATEQAFRRLGLSHLLAASGAQVGIIAGLLYGLARVLRAPPWLAAIATAPWLGLYLLLTGAPPSMVRATLMGLLGLLGLALERRAIPFAALYLTAIAMLIADPACLFDVGWQFSLLATYGLMRLGRWLKDHPLPGHQGVWGLILVPIVAWVWVSPWQLSTFYTWSWLALPANWLSGPLIFLLTPVGLAMALIGALCPPIAAACAPISSFVIGCLQAEVSWLDRLGGMERSHPGFPWWGLMAVYGALLVGLRHRRLMAVGLVAAALAACPAPRRGELEIAFLSVGQGDAIVVRTPGDRWIVIDGGPAEAHHDAGAVHMLPYLRRSGCRRVDLMIASHAHQDHVGGLPAVIAGLPVASAWDAGQSEHAPGNVAMLAGWLTHGVPWRVARPGLRWRADGVSLSVVGPWPGGHGTNDGSVVVRLDYGDFSALFTGDAEAPAERAMREAHMPLRATLLKVGHHGSRTSTSPAFLGAVKPALAVVSAGRGNRFGHPAPSTMKRLRAAGAATVRTDLAGAVLVRSNGRHWRWATGVDGWKSWRRGGEAGVDRGRALN
jgi:competence protein ComEC